MAVVVARRNAKKGGKKGKGGSSGPDQGELKKAIKATFPFDKDKKLAFRLTSGEGRRKRNTSVLKVNGATRHDALRKLCRVEQSTRNPWTQFEHT